MKKLVLSIAAASMLLAISPAAPVIAGEQKAPEASVAKPGDMCMKCKKNKKMCKKCCAKHKCNKCKKKMHMSSKGLKGSSKEYMDGMIKMHEGMDIDYTGRADTDFVRGMIPHHQGAVDMAGTLLKYGKDEELRTLAGRIITAQKQEIAFMKEWLHRRADKPSELSYDEIMKLPGVEGFERANEKMHSGMMIDYTGDADVDFARGMIPHHQGAVDMAKVLLKHGGQDAALQQLARDILLSQSREIIQMQNWLDKHPAPVAPAKGKKKHHH